MGETSDRLNSIKNAYGTTFQWIWTEPSLDFTEWLRDNPKGYWISGKPGSGKSILMKYIYEELKINRSWRKD